jgi:hypothetical protein
MLTMVRVPDADLNDHFSHKLHQRLNTGFIHALNIRLARQAGLAVQRLSGTKNRKDHLDRIRSCWPLCIQPGCFGIMVEAVLPAAAIALQQFNC